MFGIKGDPESARLINRALVLRRLRSNDSHSRAALAKQLGISKITVSQVVADLISERLVEEKGQGRPKSTGGRKPILLGLSSSKLFVIGLDIGLTNTVVALSNLEGDRLVQLRIPTNAKHDVKNILAQIDELVHMVLRKGKVPRSRILGVGISIGGLVESARGFITFSPDFGWKDVPLQRLVEKQLKLPTTIDNCTRAMAFGEKWQQDSLTGENIFYVNLGYGIGSAIVMNGRIYNNNSEFGHIRITNRNILCDCGKKGCLEAVASGHAIARIASAILGKGSDNANLSASDVAALASKGNVPATEIFRTSSRYLGRAISIAATLFNPDRVVIAGGVSTARELILGPLMDEFNATTMEVIKRSTKISFSTFGIDAGIIGALSLALNRYVFHEEAALAASI